MNQSAFQVTRSTTNDRRKQISLRIRQRLVEFLGFDSIDDIASDDTFADLGTDSSQAISFKIILEEMFGVQLRTSVLFEYPRVDLLVERINTLMMETSNLDSIVDAPTDRTLAETVEDIQAEVPKQNSSAIREDLACRSKVLAMDMSYPISETQAGLWYISEALEYASSYHVPLLFRLKAPLDPIRFDYALRQVADRHPALRVCFRRNEAGQIRQFPQPSETIPCTQLLDFEAGQSTRDALQRVMRDRFDLTSFPPVRSVYGRDDHGDFVMIVFHHIVADGLAAVPLVSELWHAYVSAEKHETTQPSTSQPSDERFWQYLQWEEQYLRSESSQRDAAYWRDSLAHCSGDLGLATIGGITTDTLDVGCISRSLDQQQTAALRMLASKLSAPLSTLLLSLYYVLLARISGKQDISVTTPVSGRPGGPRGNYQDAVGCFINLIVTRGVVDEHATLEEWVGTVRQNFLASIEHGHLPFSRQLQAIDRRIVDADRSSFPISFTYQNIFEAWQNNNDWQDTGTLDFSYFQEVEDDLTFEVYDFGSTLQFNWKFATNRLASEAVASWADCYWNLLEQSLHNPSTKLFDLDLSSPEQRQRLLQAFDRRSEAKRSPVSVLQWIDQRIGEYSDRVAVTCGEQSLTYGELAEQSRDCAGQLAGLDIQPGDIVILPAERSLVTLIRMLGILRCGAAFMPIELDAPAARTAAMIELANAKNVDWALLSDLSRMANDTQLENELEIAPESTAYVLFTSGSTGAPKGVPVRHDSLVNLCHAMIDLYGLTEQDCVLQFAALTFDMSIEEIFPVLCAGGRLVLRQADDIDPQRLASLVRECAVTVANLPPSYHTVIRSLGDVAMTEFYRQMRIVAFGGDGLSLSIVRDIERLGPQVFNVYGPTEATVNATAAEMNGQLQTTIGRPLAGVAAVVCDSQLKPLPYYIPGELCLAGVGLSRGYLGQSNQANRFTQTRWGDDSDSTSVYRTGDRAIACCNDQIQLLGRVDDQISLRGHRIEPGEIEQAIRSLHPNSESCVVESNGVLVAFLRTSDPSIDCITLRDRLPHLLPRIMIPSYFHSVDDWPLNDRRKIDRRQLKIAAAEVVAKQKALATVEFSTQSGESCDGLIPHDPIWRAIRETVCEILRVDSIQPSEGFFELGGHSLLAIATVGKLNQALGINLTLRNFLALQSFAVLHARLTELSATTPRLEGNSECDSKPSEPIYTLNHPSRGVLSPSQARLWFLDQMGEQSAYKVPALAEVSGELEIDRLKQALYQCVERHEILRTNFVRQGSTVQQLVHPRIDIPTSIASFGSRSEAETWISAQVELPFNLAIGPLLRLSVAQFGDGYALLMICMHHIVTDGWSMSVLIDELRAFYEGNDPSAIPPLRFQYADYAASLANQSTDEEGLRYWREQLNGFVQRDLVCDRARPRQLSTRGGTITRKIDPASSESIRQLSRRLNVPASAIWLAAWYLLLRKRGNGDDYVFGMPTAGRTHTDLHSLIGFFVNSIALRVNGESFDFRTMTGEQLVRHIAATIAAGLEHQTVPIEEVLHAVQPERRLDRSPLFQVLFSYAAALPRQFQLGNATLRPYVPTSNSAKFELTCSVNDFAPETNRPTSVDLDDSEISADTILAVEYATDLFEPTTISAMCDEWTAIANQLASNPAVSLGDIRLVINACHQAAALDRIEQSAAPVESFRRAFDKQVSQVGSKLAIASGDCALTYNQLIGTVEQFLSSRVTESVIVVEPKRTIESLVACIAAALSEKPFVFSSEFANLRCTDDLAYVLPTSGSTGTAKSVAISRRSMDQHNASFVEMFQVSPIDRIAQYASITFDLFIEELFPALRAGASVHVVPEAIRIDPLAFAKWTTDQSITILDLPTAVFHQIVSNAQAVLCLSKQLRLLIVGGEKLSVDAAREFLTFRPDVELWNTYGPTEATVICSAHRVDPNAKSNDIPLGQVFGQANLLVVDPDGHPLPPGVQGELVIGGPGVGLGYIINDRAERIGGFRPHPTRQGAWAYWTGDKCICDLEGTLHFRGRLDDQVKIRGHRVDPNDIVSLLKRDQRVVDASIAFDQSSENLEVIAAVQLRAETSDTPCESSTFQALAASLPAFMRPNRWVAVSSIPTTSRGKVDKSRIVELSRTLDRPEVLTKCDTETEIALFAIWSQILGHSRMGVEDDFFYVGGHSLLIAQLVAMIQEQLGIELQLMDVFLHPTIRQMAARCETAKEQIQSKSLLRMLNARGPSDVLTIILPGLPGIGDLYYPLANLLLDESHVAVVSMSGYDGTAVQDSLLGMAFAWDGAIALATQESKFKTVRFVAHSFAGSILTLMLAHEMSSVREAKQILLIDCWPHVTNEVKFGAFAGWERDLRIDVLPGAKAVVRAALNAPSLTIEQTISQPVQLIVSEDSRSLLGADDWFPFYQQVEVSHVAGDHFSIVQPSHCPSWLECLKTNTSKTDSQFARACRL